MLESFFMARSAAIVVLLLSLAGSARASRAWPREWSEAGFADVAVTTLNVQRFYVSAPPFETKGALDVHFLLLRGSGWTRADVDELLSQLTLVYSQCGLRVDQADLVEASAPLGRSVFYKYKRDDPASLNALARAVPPASRPMYYLVRGWLDSPGDDSFSRADFEEADGPEEGPRDPALFDSVFLPIGLRSEAFQREHSAYSTAAHELWHVLTRGAQHWNETPKHLGNIWMNRTNLIAPRDCALILANPLVRHP